MAYTKHQKRVAFHVYDVGRRKKASRKQLLAALETGLVESNLGNPAGGDGTSVGWRQQISGAGVKSKNRRNVRKQAGYFYDEIKGAKGGSAGQLAQAVQRSAYPGRYDQREKQASDLLRYLEKTYGKGSKGGGKTKTTGGELKGKNVTIPGVDRSAERQQVKLSYLKPGGKMPSQTALLSLAGQLGELRDTPATKELRLSRTKRRTVRTKGKVVKGGGDPVGGKGKTIGHPYVGTHTLGNWQSDRAVDLAVKEGTPILATSDGRVTKVSPHAMDGGRFAGDGVTVRGKKGDEYFFKHIKSKVKPGQRVKKGQVIGYSGSANGVAHLHFGRRKGSLKPYER